MDLEKITAKLRPRKNWEAIDLGILLVQKNLSALYKIWFIVTVPFFLMLNLIFSDFPVWALFGFWCLKPLWERPLLHYLSRHLFSENLSVKDCVKSFFKLAKIQWFASLTWRRLSFTRSLDLPLIQLENVKGIERQKRLRILHSQGSGAAVWLTIIFALSEMIFHFSLIVLAYLLLPDQVSENINFFNWLFLDSNHELIDVLGNILIYLSISVVAPFYVACGFTLYINQRTHLEAWDIELAFKRLANHLKQQHKTQAVRLVSWFFIASLCLSLFNLFPNKVMAAEKDSEIKNQVNTLIDKAFKQKKEHPENSPHAKAKNLIKQIKQTKDFHKKVIEYEYVKINSADNKSSNDPRILELMVMVGKVIAFIVKYVLWVFVVLLIIYLIMRSSHLLKSFKKTTKKKKRKAKVLFGLDMVSENLPKQSWLVAQQLIEQAKYREALSLLYRASLIWFMDNTAVEIQSSDTELECLSKISIVSNNEKKAFISQLTNLWINLAYAHNMPDKQTLLTISQQWPVVLMAKKDSQNV